jgi:hypothetical protein
MIFIASFFTNAYSVANPTAVESIVEHLQSVADSDAAADALTETSCS